MKSRVSTSEDVMSELEAVSQGKDFVSKLWNRIHSQSEGFSFPQNPSNPDPLPKWRTSGGELRNFSSNLVGKHIVCVLGTSVVYGSLPPHGIARQAPLSKEFSRQEY